MTKDTRDELIAIIRIAEDHLSQYRAYSEAMRREGRGLYLSSAYSPEHLVGLLAEAKRMINPPACAICGASDAIEDDVCADCRTGQLVHIEDEACAESPDGVHRMVTFQPMGRHCYWCGLSDEQAERRRAASV